MAMFGNTPWKLGLGRPVFGDTDPSLAPEFNPATTPPFAPMPNAGPNQGSPQIPVFANEGIGADYKPALSDKLAAIGGIFAQLGGVQNNQFEQYRQTIAANRMAQQKQRAASEAAYLPQDGDKPIIKLNPLTGKYETLYTPAAKPANNDTANDYEFYKAHFGEAYAEQWLKTQGDGLLLVKNPDGTVTPMSKRSAIDSAGGMALGTPAPPGVTFSPMPAGGPMPPASGTFPMSALDNVTMGGESGGRRYGKDGNLLRSSAGALGEMQVMPDTARHPGYGVKPWAGGPDDLARVGRDYRATMEKRYGGDLAKMWAAYNWGPRHLDNAIAARGENWLSLAPSDTQKYIRRNFGALGNR